jgi:two-component system NtrC family sensor kinase
MHDTYQIPTLILTTLLVPAFGHLYLRSRDTRTLLWFLAFCLAVVRMFLLYLSGYQDFFDGTHPWLAATGQSCALLASGLFLGSLSPLRFRIGKAEILYVIPYIVPMIVYAILAYGIFHGVAPHGPLFAIFPTLGGISMLVGLRWDQEKGSLPPWVGSTACLLFGGFAMWFCFRQGLHWPLVMAESGNHLITALLVLYVFRRFSPGVVLSVAGFVAWSLPALFIVHSISNDPVVHLNLARCIVMAKLFTALGLILVALENELAMNKAAGERERHARCEMEAYTNLELSRRRVEDFDRQGPEICRTVVANSRFSQAALILLQPAGIYHVVGSAGLDPAIARALDLWAARIPVPGFLEPGSVAPAVGNSQTLQLDLTPWLTPGDDLTRLRFTSALAVPLVGRSATEGVLLLAGIRERQPQEPLRSEDLLPIEMLASRVQAVRSQTTMLDKLIDSEKFAGIGQLAGNVTQQLNNPLTVILGYASLLEDAGQLEPHERKAVSAILSEARHMRSTLESLSRIALSHGQRAAISLPELLSDLEHLHRSEFLHRSIEFRLVVAPMLPRVLCHAQQLRQAILHCLQFSMDAVQNVAAAGDRTVRLEVTAEGGRVQILVAHSGPGFHHPERAFDPYLPAQAGGTETAGLGLSLCATILRDNHGNASAVNLEPQGAAIVLELQAA